MGNSVNGMKLILAVVLMFPGLAVAQDELAKGWAWSGIAASTLERQGEPTPAPVPEPGDVCQTCQGSGKVGDGKVFQICKDCNGTGKVTAPAGKPVQFKSICEGDSCRLVPVEQPQPEAVLQSSRTVVISRASACYPVAQYRQNRTRPTARVIMRKVFFFWR